MCVVPLLGKDPPASGENDVDDLNVLTYLGNHMHITDSQLVIAVLPPRTHRIWTWGGAPSSNPRSFSYGTQTFLRYRYSTVCVVVINVYPREKAGQEGPFANNFYVITPVKMNIYRNLK